MSHEKRYFAPILPLAELAQLVQQAQAKGQRVALTNGAFDLVHAGHVSYLAEAKKLADILIVGVNSDSSVKAYKDPRRPIQDEELRSTLLSSLKSVDYVTIFGETTAANLIKTLQPDLYIKAADYSLESLPELDTLKEYNIESQFLPVVAGHSSSAIIDSILEKYS